MIHLYPKILHNFECLIFQDGFLVEHIPFVRWVKFKLLAEFPKNYHPHPVVLRLILSLLLFAIFVYYVIDRFHIFYYFFSSRVFTPALADGFHWSPSDSKFTQVSRTLLSILADLNNAVLSIVSSRPLIFKSSSPCFNPLRTVPSAPITIDITVTFMFHIFFQFSSKISVLIFLFVFFSFYPVVSQNDQVHCSADSIFLLTITRSGRLAEIKGSICISKSQRILCFTFSRSDSLLCTYHLFVGSNLNFLHNS